MLSSDSISVEQKRPSLPSTDLVSYGALFILLAIRVPLTDIGILNRIFGPAPLPSWVQGAILVHDKLYYAYSHLAIFIVAIVVLINRRDLKRLNIDRLFLLLFLWATLAFCRNYLWPVGWAAALLAFYTLLAVPADESRSRVIEPTALRVVLLVLIVFFLCIILLRSALDYTTIRASFYWFFIRFPPDVMMEEVTFRGLLWMLLKNLNWQDGWIVAIQTVVFWSAHTIYLLADPIAFWLVVPILSLFLGVIVWRTRSISASAIAHLCINVCWSIFSYLPK